MLPRTKWPKSSVSVRLGHRDAGKLEFVGATGILPVLALLHWRDASATQGLVLLYRPATTRLIHTAQ